jgi:hypothetical protein
LYIEVSAGKADKNSPGMMPQDNGTLPYPQFAAFITVAVYDPRMRSAFSRSAPISIAGKC